MAAVTLGANIGADLGIRIQRLPSRVEDIMKTAVGDIIDVTVRSAMIQCGSVRMLLRPETDTSDIKRAIERAYVKGDYDAVLAGFIYLHEWVGVAQICNILLSRGNLAAFVNALRELPYGQRAAILESSADVVLTMILTDKKLFEGDCFAVKMISDIEALAVLPRLFTGERKTKRSKLAQRFLSCKQFGAFRMLYTVDRKLRITPREMRSKYECALKAQKQKGLRLLITHELLTHQRAFGYEISDRDWGTRVAWLEGKGDIEEAYRSAMHMADKATARGLVSRHEISETGKAYLYASWIGSEPEPWQLSFHLVFRSILVTRRLNRQALIEIGLGEDTARDAELIFTRLLSDLKNHEETRQGATIGRDQIVQNLFITVGHLVDLKVKISDLDLEILAAFVYELFGEDQVRRIGHIRVRNMLLP